MDTKIVKQSGMTKVFKTKNIGNLQNVGTVKCVYMIFIRIDQSHLFSLRLKANFYLHI